MVNATLGQILQSYKTIEQLELLKQEAIKWLNENDVDYSDWSDFDIIRHHIINCPEHGVSPVSEIVTEGVDEIFRKVINAYGIESGDVSLGQQCVIDEAIGKLTDVVERWVISRTGSDKV